MKRTLKPDEIPMYIRTRLSKPGESISDLAARIGLSRQMLHAYLKGKFTPNAAAAEKLNLTLQTTYQTLSKGE